MKKNYGLSLKERPPLRPVAMQLDGSEGSRVVQNAAKRVYRTHQKVIKALADR
ncbi:hypothetical protein GCM10007860_31240 [Chitiniphilus shinanonensis]|uniref:Uncharacterized protein n=2 Tax=Chitiniphilus shinanonensis TaxID=553088 RepID=A0ABQ6BXS4_9NEIS|nr:hypothetical protein [Chitiniphilus shinanonensis]GLS05960.1 hypothetical protein GCM10007860_31240 [Chitiniphilus shinanonensis]